MEQWSPLQNRRPHRVRRGGFTPPPPPPRMEQWSPLQNHRSPKVDEGGFIPPPPPPRDGAGARYKTTVHTRSAERVYTTTAATTMEQEPATKPPSTQGATRRDLYYDMPRNAGGARYKTTVHRRSS